MTRGTSRYNFYFLHYLIASLSTCLVGLLMWWMDSQVWGINLWKSFTYLELVYNPICEAPQPEALFRQPLATYTNLIFFFLGMSVFLLSLLDRKNENPPNNLLLRSPQYSALFSLIFFTIFLASTIYHASMIRVMYIADLVGIYSFGAFFLLFNHWKLRYTHQPSFFHNHRKALMLFLLFMLLIVFPCTVFNFLTYKRYLLIFINVLVFIQTIHFNIYRNKTSSKSLLILAISLTVLTAITSYLDSVLCSTTSFSYGHSIFHLIAGCGLFCYYLFLRSERYGVHEDVLA